MTIKTVDNVFMRVSKTEKAEIDLWFLHGFGESSLSFKEVLESELASNFNIYIPDFPGFGVSPSQSNKLSMEDTLETLKILITEISANNKLGFIGHSMGGIIGTWLTKFYQDKTIGFVNIEGNLTLADCFYSGLTTKFENSEKFYSFLKEEIFNKIQGNALERYFASFNFALPEVMYNWGRSGTEASRTIGDEYLKLSCPKTYFWSPNSTPKETQKFIADNNIENLVFQNSGHWPMIDETKKCYSEILKFFSKDPNLK